MKQPDRRDRVAFALVLGSLALAMVGVAAGASWRVINGTATAETIRGTGKADTIYGRGGGDKLYGLAGDDRLIGGAGRDTLYCGAGRDTVVADTRDKAAADCEVVLRPRPQSPKPPTPPAPTPARGTRSTPYALGRDAPVLDGTWRLRVNSATPDATATVLAESQSNSPPAPDHQFYIVNVTATYVGEGTDAALSIANGISFVGPASFSYRAGAAGCGDIPGPFDGSTRLSTGASLSGNVCHSVTTTDAAELVLAFSPATGALRQIFFGLPVEGPPHI